MKNIIISEEEFESIFRKYYPEMVRYCVKIVAQPHIAEEIVSGLFIKLWEKRENIRIHHSVKNFLLRSVKHEGINYLKSQYKRLTDFQSAEENLIPENTSGSDSMEMEDLISRINIIMQKMPEKTSLIFRMSRFGGLTHREIANSLNLGTKAIEYHINSALNLLRKELKDLL